MSGGSLDNKQLNDYVSSGPLTDFYQPPDTVWTPHVLKDGSDSVGALGALNRVFLNIGLFSEEWLLHFQPLIGGEVITPIKIKDARKNSTYWEATEAQTPDLARFFLKATGPHKLKDAPGGDTWLVDDFCVAEPHQWLTVGEALLSHASTLVHEHGAAQIVVACADRDLAKAEMLRRSGLTIASNWWTKPLR